ncbi:hotdog fold domain-containing protein [Luteipulveratus sp. YIM 133132]|uniref:hotdog fold domain-containing protein n=1 Tax=Luteipulveratus flavus TaxID=3031728 RepID=UPI0023B18065|nr:hotdog fold domain-containing protein [Luteipulveratus sp. YIM 133132]MDE9367579.1 hotdog fold domain-containing protein [Luteipulveratus sp. YIM 133132]
MTSTYELYRRAGTRPLGRKAFSLAYMLKAPYFASVRPQVIEMREHRAVVQIRKRRAVQNHIGTVHAIAVANGMEAAMGLLAEATTPSGMRWIPKGIQLEYVAKATSDVRCVAETDAGDWAHEPPFQVDVRCTGVLADGTEVVRGTIPIWVTAKK